MKTKIFSSVLSSVVFVLLGTTAFSQNANWTGGVNGNWDNAGNWSAAVPTGIATFNNAVNTTISLNGANRTLTSFAFNNASTGSFTFNDQTFLLNAGGNIGLSAGVAGGTQTFNSGISLGGNYTFSYTKSSDVNASLIFNGNITNSAASVLTLINNQISSGALVLNSSIAQGVGSLSLRKTSPGSVFLLGLSDFTGGISVDSSLTNNGALIFSTVKNAGTSSALGSNGVLSNGSGTLVLRYIGTGDTTNRVLEMGAVGTNFASNASLGLASSGSGALNWTSNLTQVTNGVGDTQLRTFTLEGTNTGANKFSGVIGNSANSLTALVKNGISNWTLDGANSFTGNITVNGGGKLILDYATNAAVIHPTNTIFLRGGNIEFLGRSGAFSTNQTIGTVNLSTDSTGIGTITLNRNSGNGVALTSTGFSASTNSNLFFVDLGNTANSFIFSANQSVSDIRKIVRDGNGRVDFLVNSGSSTAVSSLNAATDLPATGGVASINYRLTGNQTVTGGVLGRSLRIDPSANNQSLTLNNTTSTANNVTNQGVLFVGPHDFTITSTGTGALGDQTTTASRAIIAHFGAGKLTLDTPLGGNSTGGTGTVEFYGSGLIDWTRAANTTGSTTIGGVVLRQTSNNGALLTNAGGGNGSGNIIINTGGVWEIAGGGTITRNISNTVGGLRILGDGGFSAFDGTANIQLNNGTGTLDWGSNNFVAADNALILSSSSSNALVNFQNGLGLGQSQRVVRVNNGSATVDGRLSGVLTGGFGGGLIKQGAGTLEVTGTNTYGGDTWINAGTLLVNNTAGSGTGTGRVIVFSGGTLGGNGTIGGGVTVQSGGTLSPGNSPGLLSVGSLTQESGSLTLFEINGTGRGTTFDAIDIASGGGVQFGGNFNITFGIGSALADNTTLSLFGFNTTSTGDFSNLVSTGFYAGTWNKTGELWSLASGGQVLTFSELNGSLTVVPEPATWILLTGGLMAVLLSRRNRRRIS